jgi:hypothetical protein
MDDYILSARNRSNQRTGSHGETLANSVLHGLGIEMLQKIGTPVKLTPYRDRGGRGVKGVYYVKFEERVKGDRHGVLPDGTSVLIEVKTYWDRNLRYSDLDDHQHADLREHAGIGAALSLLVWVHNSGVWVMQYGAGGIAGFLPRSSISPERAEELHDETIRRINEIVKWGSKG